MRHIFLVLFTLSVISGGFAAPGAFAAESSARRITLPAPQTTGGMPLMEALAARKTERRFSDKPVSEQTLSDLLWATWGVNRPDGKRTAPTAKNRREVNVYAALESGVWLYDATENALVLAAEGDFRKKLGGSPLTLLFAVPEQDPYGDMHAGSLYQNAGLYCASAGLGNVVKGTGKDALNDVLPLPAGYKVVIIQSIGWPR